MSLPRELLEQLLTGYLDDALSADERARVEQLLQSNPEIVDELAQLRVLRQSLRAIAQADSTIRLEEGFADRVLGAAVARARAEGLSDDHPLVRLAEQPSTTGTQSHFSTWRVAGVLVGLAASIAIAVVALRPNPAGPEGAMAEAQPPNTPQSPFIVPDPAVDVPSVEPDKIASSDPGAPAPGAPTPESPNTTPRVVDPAKEPMKQLESPPSLAEAIAKSQNRGADSVVPPAVTKDTVPRTKFGMILVVNVRRSEAGRQTNAVRQAMEVAALERTSEKEVTDEIVGIVRKATEPQENDIVSVLYLQSTAKKLDRFYLELLNDFDGIESVRLAYTMDGPLLDALTSMAPDPTLIRHDEASLELFSETSVVSDFAAQLGQLDYGPMDRSKKTPVIPSVGPDVPAQMLVLVR